MSGDRGRLWNGGHLRHHFGAAKIHRWRDRARIGIHDKLSLSAHGVTPEALTKRATLGRWKIDDRGDALRRGDRLSRAGAGNPCPDQVGAFCREKSACDRDRRLWGFDW